MSTGLDSDRGGNEAILSSVAAPRDIHALVVDDKAFIRNTMKRLLEGLGVRLVTCAENGRQAMEILHLSGIRIDVVFCDLQMPDMDGIEVVRNAATGKAPPAFAFVSGEGGALLNTIEDMARARGISVLGVIRKPASRESVKQILDRVNAANGGPARGTCRAPVFVPAKADIEAALARGDFLLYYQPKQNLQTGLVDGFETLIRWLHPVHGMVAPGAFIGQAEQLGLIGPITDWVVKAALEQCSIWNGLGSRTKLSINLSARMLVDLEMPDRLAAEALRMGIDARQIILEVTETGLFADLANTLDILARLHMKGFNLSIDDFGTGYSSMEQLRRVPFTEMKIDRAFVHRLPENARARAILESSAALARSLGMTVVAEGAETVAELQLLKSAEIDLVQGYIVAKPMPAKEVLAWLPNVADHNAPGLRN